ncbi:MAG TPA: RidA family protein [Trueperaceae bacterium]
MTAEKRVVELGLQLPSPPAPVASYLPAVRSGQLLFVSGQGPTKDGVPVYRGKVGGELSEDEGRDAARLCAINLLAVLRSELGSLDEVTRMVKLLVLVASENGFDRQPFVANAASDLLAEVFGPAGRHARSAVGTNQLPFDIPVEIELIAEVGSR